MRIVEAYHKKERPGMFPFEESDGSLGQPVIIMRMNGGKPELLIRYGRSMYMPFPGVGTFVTGTLHQPA